MTLPAYPSEQDTKMAINNTFPTPANTTISNPRLRVLNKLRAGETPLTTFLAFPSVRVAQIVALTGLDGVVIDCEHGESA